ncbi:adhesion G protein-coupled receptor B2 [Trichonephila clavipes]|uniref:Adhesion G protein-coupled receptor B2 n=1 Tax=Trichonephila clavipes TaxID=2585209 RepID=A0A8X6V4W3_TRICX|nr:adhesion G protein-coupled receptor B2 [Trichonephila clavipes]
MDTGSTNTFLDDSGLFVQWSSKIPAIVENIEKYEILRRRQDKLFSLVNSDFTYFATQLFDRRLHFKYDFWHRTATAGTDVDQSGRPIFDDFFQYLWPYIGNNMVNVVFQMVKRLWLIRIDQ